MARLKKWLKRLFLLILIVAIGVVVSVYFMLRASLPTLNGEVTVASLSAPLEIRRDKLGVATIVAANRLDAMAGLGYVHAQERFFIMDLTRRDAAGELSALFGEVAADYDARRRLHRFRARAASAIASLPEAQRLLLLAYSQGVNQGLADLRARPPEYFLLGAIPEPWQVEDSILVVYAMFFDLQDERAERDANLGLMHSVLPPDLAAFLSPPGSDHDAPLDDSVLPLPVLPAVSPELSFGGWRERSGPLRGPEERIPGSNNWAVAASRSVDGRAWMANDMHLGLRNPNIWFRAQLRYPRDGQSTIVTGVTLPGTPGIVAGSNGKVAWGFTNSYGDYSDRIVLQLDPDDANRYRTPDGWRAFDAHAERIAIDSAKPRDITVLESIWGPVVTNADGSRHAIRWTAHAASAADLLLADMDLVGNLDEALDLANQIGAPAQNFVAADHVGTVGWTLMGRLPERPYPASRLPVDSSRAGDGQWRWLDPADYPRVVNPGDGLIWTANARVMGGEGLAKVGDGGYADGFRAGQIRDGLRSRNPIARDDHLAIHLDDRALFLTRWQQLMLATLDDANNNTERNALANAVKSWGGHAAVDSVGYLAVRRFRLLTMDAVIGSLTQAVKDRHPDFDWSLIGQLEQPLWTLVSQQPETLLPAPFTSWNELLLSAADRTLTELTEEFGSLEAATWGARNRVAPRHPLSNALPSFLATYLDAPVLSLPGDSHMPRVQSTAFGASQRSAVSPGNEKSGYFHMPTGQSGHLLSPFFVRGHMDWAQGRPTPFLPSETEHTLKLVP